MGANRLPEKLAAEKRPQKHGGALLNGGVVGHNGKGTGRPSHASLIRYETMMQDPKHWEYLQKISHGAHGPAHFLDFHHKAMERLVGRVPQPIGGSGEAIRVEIVLVDE